ncbi:MAG: type I glyceraldehyde-3-phosphate dehydrogenase [Bacilli bacterium]|nr:type I glyceraldehyde-3-phosphate dehydrogenase [Bacilli bacterium]
MIRIAINGFGRIGRLAFRQIITTTDFDIVAINDPGDAKDLAYLAKYDTVHRSFHEDLIKEDNGDIVVNQVKRIKVFHEMEPERLPWRELNVDLVLECSGKFTKYEDAYKHITAGAKKVLISAPSKSDNVKTVVYNVNENILDGTEVVVSAASCTTNCLAPVVNLLEKNIGIISGFMSTVHAYTNDQATLDISHKKGIMSRRGRACSANIIPTSTGAASAIGKVIPSLSGKLEGGAYRVPVEDGSLVEFTFIPSRATSMDEINKIFELNQSETIKITYDPVVSSDIIGKTLGALVDGLSTSVNNNLVKVVAWYDNEYGYTAQMLRTAKAMFK